MAVRRYVVALVAVLALVVGYLLTTTVGSEPLPTRQAANSGQAGPTPGRGEPTEDPTRATVDGRSTSPFDSEAVAAGRALEMPDPRDRAPRTLGGPQRSDRAVERAEGELRRDYPALQVRRGTLPALHPHRNVPVLSGADVVSASLATASGRTQVGVVTRSPLPVDSVLRFYRLRLARVGFVDESATGTGQPGTASFRRRADSVVVVAEQQGSRTLVTVHATLQTGA